MTLVINDLFHIYSASNQSVPSEDCSFCLSSLKEEDKKVVQLACNHFFHEPCLQRWVRSSNPSSGKCGLCRRVIHSRILKDLRRVCCVDIDVYRTMLKVGAFAGVVLCNLVEVGFVVGSCDYYQESTPQRHFERSVACFSIENRQERKECLEAATVQAKYERTAGMAAFLAYAVIFPLEQVYCALKESENGEEVGSVFLALPPFIKFGWEVVKGSCLLVFNVSRYAVGKLMPGVSHAR
ncbi:MAG: hypothetical protein ACI9S8_002769 [Chlamydiales bacterium]|jgi:hypothetical protein